MCVGDSAGASKPISHLPEVGGANGIVLSNHGGRQLDRAPIPFHLLPDVVREVGATPR